jgi:hypothetical protein
MAFHEYRVLFTAIIGILTLITASPALQRVLVYPQTEFFTEIWLLGPRHNAENYPHNITNNANYTAFLGVANHLGSCAYYIIEMKFRNETQSAPNSFNHTHSSLSSLYSLTIFVADNDILEVPFTFAFNYKFQNVIRVVYSNVTVPQGPGKNATIEQRAYNVNVLQASFDSLRFNDVTLSLKGYSSDWNPKTREYFGNLIFELWVYNSSVGSFQYHERYVDLKFNMTSNGMGEILRG